MIVVKRTKGSSMRRKHVARNAMYASGFAMVLLLGFVPEARAFDKPDLLSVQIRGIAIKGERIDQVLGRLTEYDIPVGIELVDEKLGIEVGDEKLTPRREITLDLPETSLKDFLDSVVAKDPRYTWKLDGGVIHVWPVKGRDALVATLLDTKISHFAFVGGVSRYAIQYEIMDLPEISAQLVVADVAPLVFRSLANMAKLEKGTFFEESNVSLRELLDRIVLKTEIKQWVIVRWGKNSEYIALKLG
jgi:hypothetical protein